jgi:protein-disulfide isomerase
MSDQENHIHDDNVEEIDEGQELQAKNRSDDTITFRRAHLYSVLLPLAFVGGLLFGYIFWGRDNASASTQPSAAVAAAAAAVPEANPGEAVSQAAEPTPEFRRYDIPEDDDPVWGSDQAAITIIEFSDYECPYCRKWHVEVWPSLQAEYGDQIRLVFRDFPLTSIHSNAVSAAAAANCAGEQEMYWEYSDKLFGMRLSLGKSAYQAYAEELNLDMEAFNACLDSDRYVEEVMADFEYAANLGIRSTPTFFVNGIPVVGAQPFEVFKNLIDKELAGELPK